jgi:hypothetical protein
VNVEGKLCLLSPGTLEREESIRGKDDALIHENQVCFKDRDIINKKFELKYAEGGLG